MVLRTRPHHFKRIKSGNKTSVVAKIRRTTDDSYTSDWVAISKAIKTRDGYKCTACGSESNLNVHHIIPISKGGRNISINLTTLCHRCHSKQPGHSHMR